MVTSSVRFTIFLRTRDLITLKTGIPYVPFCLSCHCIFWIRPDGCGLDRSQSIPAMAVDTLDPFYVRCCLLSFCCPCPDYYFSVSGVCSIPMLFVLTETRSTVILARIARQTRKDTGDGRYRARSEIDKPCFMSMVATSCTRPLSQCIH